MQRVAEEVIKGPTKAYPGIPEPFDVSAGTLYPTVEALKLAVDTLIRHRGALGDSAVLVEDLNRLIEYLDRRYVLEMGEEVTIKIYSAAITDNAGNGTVAGDCAATDFTGNKYARDQALLIEANHLVTFTHKDIAYLWVGPAPISVGIGGSYTPVGADFVAVGTSDHAVMSNRDIADQHPQTAIGGRSGGGSDLKLDQDIQDGRLGNLETWREAHEPGVDPHPQYILPEELSQTLVSYFLSSQVNQPPDYDLTQIRPTLPATSIATSVDADDVLCGRFSGPPLAADLLYAELESRVVVDISGEDRATFVYAKAILNLQGGGQVELGVSSAQLLQENRGTYTFVVQILGPVQASAGDWTSVEIYGTKDAGGTARTVELWVDHGVSRNITFIPIPAYPAEHAVSHEPGGSDELVPLEQHLRDVPDPTLTHNPHGMMRWAGAWAPGQYLYHDVTQDSGYLAIANKNTGDRPAPQPAGAAFFVYDGASPISSITAKQLTVGQRYTLQQDAFLSVFRVYTSAGNKYRVYSVIDPLGVPIIEELLPAFEASSTGWQTFTVDQAIGLEGTVFDLYVSMEEPDPTPTVWTGNWDYDTPNLTGTPAAGVIQHANQDLANLRVAKLDNDGGDRAVEIAALTPGDIIEALGVRWAIQTTPSDQGTWFLIAVAPASQAAPDGVTQFSFETVAATPIVVVDDVNYWLGLASIVGRYQVDGGAWVETEDQYSIDLQVQALTVSGDWDLMSLPGGGGGGGTESPTAIAWGDIFGNLADQADLQAALDNKRDVNQGSTFG